MNAAIPPELSNISHKERDSLEAGTYHNPRRNSEPSSWPVALQKAPVLPKLIDCMTAMLVGLAG